MYKMEDNGHYGHDYTVVYFDAVKKTVTYHIHKDTKKEVESGQFSDGHFNYGTYKVELDATTWKRLQDKSLELYKTAEEKAYKEGELDWDGKKVGEWKDRYPCVIVEAYRETIKGTDGTEHKVFREAYWGSVAEKPTEEDISFRMGFNGSWYCYATSVDSFFKMLEDDKYLAECLESYSDIRELANYILSVGCKIFEEPTKEAK